MDMNWKGIFKKGGSHQEESSVWKSLQSEESLKELIEQSHLKPQLLFKHSTRCGISRMVWSQNRSRLESLADSADLHFLDLLTYRDVSNAVARDLQIPHESPQLLIVHQGEVVAHDSHGGISQMDIEGKIL